MSFAIKLASAITGSLSIWLLAATGYVAGAQQSASAMTGINVIVNLIPALLQLVGIIPLIWYKLDSTLSKRFTLPVSASFLIC